VSSKGEEAGKGVVLINPFEVSAHPDADDQFVAQWEQARAFLQRQDGYLATTLHRSLTSDAEFRFINVARWRSPHAFQQAMACPEFPGRQMTFVGRPALYRVAVDEAPAVAETSATPVVLINLFEVPPGADADEAFLAGWGRTRDVLRGRPGYLGTRLHQSLAAAADFRFVNIAWWEGPQAFALALGDPGFRKAAAGIHYPAHPSLYQVVRQ